MKACLQQPTNVLFQRIYQLLNVTTCRDEIKHVFCVVGYTPLILAVIGGHLSCVKMLVAVGAQVGQPDGKSGRTALHHAVEADNVAIAGYVLLEVTVSFI